MPQWRSEAPLLPSLGDFGVSSTEFASAVAWSSLPAAGAASPAPGEEGDVKGGVKPRVGAVALGWHHPSGKHCSGAGRAAPTKPPRGAANDPVWASLAADGGTRRETREIRMLRLTWVSKSSCCQHLAG